MCSVSFEGLRLELSPDEKVELARKTTADAAATEEYLRGRDCLATFIYHTIEREHLDSAMEHFRRAIEIDPNFALAYSALGSCYVNRVLKGLGQAGDHEKAKNAFKKLWHWIRGCSKHECTWSSFISLVEKRQKRARKSICCATSIRTIRVCSLCVGSLLDSTAIMKRRCGVSIAWSGLNPGERVLASYNRGRIFMYQRMYEEAMRELDQGAAARA